MKRVHETPSVEVVKFQYRDQVAAASGASCTKGWINVAPNQEGYCAEDNKFQQWYGNQS